MVWGVAKCRNFGKNKTMTNSQISVPTAPRRNKILNVKPPKMGAFCCLNWTLKYITLPPLYKWG